jgi:hypothetical protein
LINLSLPFSLSSLLSPKKKNNPIGQQLFYCKMGKRLKEKIKKNNENPFCRKENKTHEIKIKLLKNI